MACTSDHGKKVVAEKFNRWEKVEAVPSRSSAISGSRGRIRGSMLGKLWWGSKTT